MRLTIEPNLNPPVDEEATRLAEYVDDLDLDELADVIRDRPVEARIRHMIFESLYPKGVGTGEQHEFFSTLVDSHDLKALIMISTPTVVEKVREDLRDFLTHAPKPEKDDDREI